MTNDAHHALDAERALIGAVMLDPSTIDHVRVRPDEMSLGLPRIAWGTMLEQRERGEAIDPLTTTDSAHCAPELKAELPLWLAGALADTLTAANIEYHAAIVRRHALTRGVLAASADLQEAAARGIDGEDLLSEALRRFTGLDIGQEQAGAPIGELVRTRYHELEALMDANARGETCVTGYTTGVPVLDAILGGIQPGVVTLVAARPGMGKTSFGRLVADVNSARGIGVDVYSLEDTRAAYLDRCIGDHAEVPVELLRAGKVRTREEMGRVRDAAQELVRRRHWHVDDRSGIDASEIVRSVRRARRENDTRIVVVDYVQLLKRRQGLRPHEAIGENMNKLADAAKQDDLAYVVLSQLNRESERRDDKRPRLSDLKECGTLEERSKAVIGLYRPAMHTTGADETALELHVLKNTNGRTGYCDAYWDGPLTRIR